MTEILTLIIFVWLLTKVIGLTFRLTWGAAKVVAGILIGLALPVLIICMVFAGGIALLLPIAVVGLGFGILKACV